MSSGKSPRFCSQCGSAIEAGVNYCSNCGTQVEIPKEHVQNARDYLRQSGRWKRSIKWLGLGFIGLFVILVIVAVLLGDEEEKKPSPVFQASSPGTVHFCEIQWDFSDYVRLVGSDAVTFTFWKKFYQDKHSLEVVAGSEASEAARDIFVNLREFSGMGMLESLGALNEACLAEGYDTTSKVDPVDAN